MSTLVLNLKAMHDFLFGKPAATPQFIVESHDHADGTPGTQSDANPFQADRMAFSSLQPVAEAFAASRAEIAQLKFLLASAPMIDAPSDLIRLQCLRVPFAYVHPKTMAGMLPKMYSTRSPRGFMIFPGSPTKWVLVSLMPEGRVIFSPLPIPGLEKILAQ
jgi:hypothetical protein